MAPSKGNQVKYKKACQAMNRYGISAKTVKSALKRLLVVYEKNWTYIEEDEYKVLLDFIIEPDGPKEMEIVKNEMKLIDESDEEEAEEETRPLKRKPRWGGDEASSSTPAGYENGDQFLALEYNKVSEANKNEDENANENENEDVPPSPCASEIDIASSPDGEVKLLFSICKLPPGFCIPSLDAVMKHVEDAYRDKFQGFGTDFSLAQLFKDVCQCVMEQGNASDHDGNKIPSFDNFKEPEKQGGPTNDPIQIGSSSLTSFPKEQSIVDICMEQGNASDHVSNKLPSLDNFKEPETQGGPANDPIKIPRFVISGQFDHCFSGKKLMEKHKVGIDELSSSLTTFPMELSTVDLCIENGNASDHVGNKLLSLDNLKELEKKGGIEDGNASDHVGNELLSLDNLKEPEKQGGIEEGNASDHHVGNKLLSLDNSKEPEKQGSPTNDPIKIPSFVVSSESDHCFSGKKLSEQQMGGIDELSGSSSLTISPEEQSTVDISSKHYFLADITRGLEKQAISLINEVDNEKLPTFTYIQANVNYNTANVKFMLARISDENSCPNCFGDCISAKVPCACAMETGGEFAYTTEGSVDENFLKSCIDITLKPTKKDYFYCDDCPLERMKKETTNQSQNGLCKGHLVRKFIKECWYKCGCGLNCGNRVIQRGIQAKLQVFMTPEGKGWGLRTLEDLPKGTFVCEYVGEVVTNSELFERNEQKKNEEHTYPVLLDADWSSEGFLQDEEALCLDATFFGNVARFINHRCVDANMVEIPVEVESPDHHYYHHSFFTTREVKSMEELTWDYGIDFDDDSHPVKAFTCKCGSKSCKGVKRKKRSRRGQ